ncbi:MAG TPA: hypothetical protein PK093_22780 [Phycisphaerae bacterium]|nr:hypothetical protein [Phycisphaerae bacterium]
MPKRNPTKKGRPPEFVKDDEGADIKGLSSTPIKRKGKLTGYRYYATYSKPRKYFGSDRQLAIMRFRSWESQQKEESILIPHRKRPTPADLNLIERYRQKLDGKVFKLGEFDSHRIPLEIRDRMRLALLKPDSEYEKAYDIEFTVEFNDGQLDTKTLLPAEAIWPRIQYYTKAWKARAEKESGGPIHCTMDSIRDGTQNAADEANCDPIHTAMLLGHVLPGVGDAYKQRRPKKTERAVEAIHNAYRITKLVADFENRPTTDLTHKNK